MDYLFLALSWALFYTLHSGFAGLKLKKIFRGKTGMTIKWYRLIYSIISSLFFLGILFQSALIPTCQILSKGSITEYLAYVFAGFGTIIMVKSTKQISLSRFLGIFSRLDQIDELVVSGLYSKIRHPLYAGLLLTFIGYFLFAGTAAAAVHLICLALYVPIRIYFEEESLVAYYGQFYKEYQEKVPPFFPWI
ncbi:MAG: protein-S-isoprenylcysteine O-methyltransferase Ste14 [Algoriphagus sp.]|jgi:protein-S-isoprenylcysteine O-methyltransferase Ste14